MGKRLVEYYRKADQLGGLVAQIRLSTLLRMTSTQAEAVDDAAELLGRAEKSFDQVRGEFNGQTPLRRSLGPSVDKRTELTPRQSDGLRRHISVYVELLSQRSLFLGDVDATLRRVNEAAASTLDIARVSVWFLGAGRSSLRCADLYEKNGSKHSSGVELFAKDFPSYFEALDTERTIAANDAHHDPRTNCFSAPYLTPLLITSMLDVPIRVNERMVGVICHEHIGPKRIWSSDEETFAYFMANVIALALERVSGHEHPKP